jgi:hypothetical protein
MPLNWWRRIVSKRPDKPSRTLGTLRPNRNRYIPEMDVLEERVTPALAFGPPETLLTLLGQGNPTCVVTGDFANNGKTDVVVGNNNSTLNMLLGRGDGTFTPPVPIPIISQVGTAVPVSMCTGDFNNDGKLDLAVLSAPTQEILLYAGDGNGGFLNGMNPISINLATIPPFPGPAFPTDIVSADLNGDGKLDFAVAAIVVQPPPLPPIDVWTYVQNGGGGNFTVSAQGQAYVMGVNFDPLPPHPPIPLGASVYGAGGPEPHVPTVAVANLDGDQIPDVVATSEFSNNTVEYDNNSAGFFTMRTQVQLLTPMAQPQRVAIGDFNGDHKADLAILDNTTGDVFIFLNKGSGFFLPAPDFVLQAPATAGTPSSDPQFIVSADMDQSGFPDLVVAYTNNQFLSIFRNKNDGSGNFDPAVVATVNTPGAPPLLPVWVAVADLNGDGKPDLVTANFGNNTVTSILNESTPTSFATIDYTAIATDRGINAQIFIYETGSQNGKEGKLIGSFAPFGKTIFTGGLRVAIGDINGPDNTADLIVTTGPGGVTVVAVYDGAKMLSDLANGKAPTPIGIFFPFGPFFGGGAFVAAGNIEGTGRDAIVVSADAGGGPEVNVYSWQQIQAGNFTAPAAAFFAEPIQFTGGIRVACADVNGDKLDDVITAAGPGGGPEVNVYFASGKSGSNLFAFQNTRNTLVPLPDVAFFAFGPHLLFFGGIYVTAGDYTGDGRAEIICGAGAGGGPVVSVWSGIQIAQKNFAAPTIIFDAYIPTFTGGVRVGDTLGDVAPGGKYGRLLTTGAGPGGGPTLAAWDLVDALIYPIPIHTVFPTPLQVGPGNFTNGIFVAVDNEND